MLKPDGIIVVLEDGVVCAVVTHNPAFRGLPVTIVDYDVDGAGREDLSWVGQSDGTRAAASVYQDIVEDAELLTVSDIENDPCMAGITGTDELK